MSEPLAWVALVSLGALGYALGSLSAGYALGRARNVDLRETGSGSTGATNALRALGPGPAAAVAAFDIAKGALAVYLAAALTGGALPAEAAAGLGAVVGHSWPLALRGRGGRGMTPAVGATLLLVPQVAPIALASFVLAIALTRFVSLGSLAAVSLSAAGYLALAALGTLAFDGAVAAFLLGTTVIVFVRHRDNIARLLAGREPRIGEPRPARSPGG